MSLALVNAWSLPELAVAIFGATVWFNSLSLKPANSSTAAALRSYRVVLIAVSLIILSLFLQHSGLVLAKNALLGTYLLISLLTPLGMRRVRAANQNPVTWIEALYWGITLAGGLSVLLRPDWFARDDLINPLGYPMANPGPLGAAVVTLHLGAVVISASQRMRSNRLGPIYGTRTLARAWLLFAFTALLQQATMMYRLPLPPMNWFGALALIFVFARLIYLYLDTITHDLERANQDLRSLSSDLERRIEERTQQIEFQAMHDALTGLPNRAQAERGLNDALEEARAAQRHVAVLLIDLDRFKDINDTFGHPIGDAVLCEIANRFQACMPANGLLARLGGDEFTVILSDLGPDQAAPYAEGIARGLLDSLASTVRVGDAEFFLDASIGMSCSPQDGNDTTTLQKNADAAMYRAKERGLGYGIFDTDLSEETRQRLEIERNLRLALEGDPGTTLHLTYQPVVEIATGRIVSFEALLRWTGQEDTMPPNRFIPVAENSGLIVPLGTWVLREACQQMMRWLEAGLPEVRLSVNVSTRQFERPDFVDIVRDILKDTRMPPQLLMLELLEGVLVQRFEETAARMLQLRALGVRLALDDFGTGYSSLSYLHQLTFDTLKIDRSFVKAMSEHDRRSLVSAALSIANAFGIEAVIEGIETQEQLETLTRMGGVFTQGYIYAPPIAAGSAANLLRQQRLEPSVLG